MVFPDQPSVFFGSPSGSLAPPLRAPAPFNFIPCAFFQVGVVFGFLLAQGLFDPAGSQRTVP